MSVQRKNTHCGSPKRCSARRALIIISQVQKIYKRNSAHYNLPWSLVPDLPCIADDEHAHHAVTRFWQLTSPGATRISRQGQGSWNRQTCESHCTALSPILQSGKMGLSHQKWDSAIKSGTARVPVPLFSYILGNYNPKFPTTLSNWWQVSHMLLDFFCWGSFVWESCLDEV